MAMFSGGSSLLGGAGGGGGEDESAVMAQILSLLLRSGGLGGSNGPNEQLQKVLQAQSMTGQQTGLGMQAANLLQEKGNKDAIKGMLGNPNDAGVYKDFWQNPSRFMGALEGQESDYHKSKQLAKDAWVAKHARQGLAQYIAAHAPAHGNPGNYMPADQAQVTGGADYPGRDDYERYVQGEEYLPYYLRSSYGGTKPTFELQNELDWFNANPEQRDKTSGQRFGDPYASGT